MPTRRKTTKEHRIIVDAANAEQDTHVATRALRILTSARCSLRALHRSVLSKACDALTSEIDYLVNEDVAFGKAAAALYASGEPQHVNYEVEPMPQQYASRNEELSDR